MFRLDYRLCLVIHTKFRKIWQKMRFFLKIGRFGAKLSEMPKFLVQFWCNWYDFVYPWKAKS